MLLQSHAGEIELLPALPRAWPHGSVKGLKARGGFTVDLTWADGTFTEAQIQSTGGGQTQVRQGDRIIAVNLSPGQRRTLRAP
jgi:alpha-L-fucosidase 2